MWPTSVSLVVVQRATCAYSLTRVVGVCTKRTHQYRVQVGANLANNLHHTLLVHSAMEQVWCLSEMDSHELDRMRALTSVALSHGHEMVDIGSTPCAPGVFARCTLCNATLRWYHGIGTGEAAYTWCPYAIPTSSNQQHEGT